MYIPIAIAVSCASPVTILTSTPLPCNISMDSLTSGLGGSVMPTIPMNIKS